MNCSSISIFCLFLKDSACNVLSQGLKQKSLLENSSDSVRFVVVMSLKMRYPLAVLFTFLLYNCSALTEASVQILPLAGPLADRESEVSGLAWDGDRLILLPENPERFPHGEYGSLFYLTRSELEAAIIGEREYKLLPKTIPFDDSNLSSQIPGYEGFEAIAFIDDVVYMTIEAKTDSGMMGYLVKGEVESGLEIIHLDPTTLQKVKPQSDIRNMTYESLVLTGDGLMTFHEINGVGLNSKPEVVVYDFELSVESTLPLEHLEYRITDATDIDSDGKFWVINYYWPGDKTILPAVDPLAEHFGEGPSHLKSEAVERLVEFRVENSQVRITNHPPIQLEQIEEESRNWEGVVRLDNRGFLLITDKYPETIFAFVRISELDQ
jgi:hypothetical protein|tara:strand:- start:668 stop:1807 length:1140 start_codon:yes stop_codon:yes gene_type:complete